MPTRPELKNLCLISLSYVDYYSHTESTDQMILDDDLVREVDTVKAPDKKRPALILTRDSIIEYLGE
jgi:hypothetical protein